MKARLRILIVSICLILPLSVLAQVEPTDNNGNGFRNVSTLEHLRWISENPESWNDNFELDNDIDASDTESWNNGAGWSPIGTYSGTFEGNGYEIQNLYINRPESYGIGLFGYSSGTIQNLGLTNVDITGYYGVGGLAGANEYGTIINVFCTASVSGNDFIGGLVGISSGIINNSFSSVSVSGNDTIGGLVGLNSGIVLNSYSTGDVSGIDWVGGLTGANVENWDEVGIITNSFSIGKVVGTGSKVGGLVGLNEGFVRCSFWDIESSGQDTSAGGTGKTTEEMKNLSTYIDAGWNFDFIWNIDDDYPYIDIDFSYRPTDTNGNGFINISTLKDLRWLSELGYDLDKDWELDNYIDAKDTESWNCGAGWLPISYLLPPILISHWIFSGTFEGNGYEIDNLFINRPLQNFIGLFSVSSGKIQNLGLTNVNIIGGDLAGGIVGMNEENGTIFNSYTTGSVSGNETVGGLVGYNDNGLILSNYFTGSVNGNFAVGGLVGVSGSYDRYNNCTIKNCYSTGTVSGGRAVGGLVGGNSGSISNSYSSSVVSGGNGDGGLVGLNSGAVSCSFWDIESSGQETSDGGIGKTTEEMKSLSTYIDSGWNFDFVWSINNGYPFIDIDFSYQPTDTNDNGFINISTLNDLRWLSETGYDLDKDWELDNNINASYTENWNCGEGWLPIDIFSGTLEGNGYVIDSLYINKPEHSYLGFFSGLNGTIQNLGITNANIIGDNYVGSLVGSNNGSILKSYSKGTVSGYYSIGGLVGENQYGGKINKSYSTGKVDGYHAGGLVGTNSGSITNSYSRAVVSGGQMLGGLVGSCYGNNFGENRNRIKNCYSTGEVVSKSDFFVSGLIGYIEIYWGYNSVESCFWDVETSKMETSSGGTGKSTAEMKTKSTFTDVNWDFEVIWSIHPDINDGYPYLLMITPTSVAEEQEPYNFNVYPNPFAGSLNIEFDLPAEMPISIVLIDNSGKIIKHIHNGFGNAGRNNHIVEFTELPSGLYFLILSANGEMLTQKVISVR